ncbi:unnamed protein product, partial [Prorocentrum cordatum]
GWAGRAMARTVGRARERHLHWTKKAWKGAPGKLLRFVVAPGAQKPGAELNRSTASDPYAVANRAAGSWRQAWTANACDDRQIIWARANATRLAREDLCPNVEPRFPPVAAAPEAQLLLAPRHLRARGWVSDIIGPRRSMFAGSRRGGKPAKVCLGFVLAAAHINCASAGIWSFVDDAAAGAEGASERVAVDLTGVDIILCKGMTATDLKVSPKTAVLAPSPAVALAAHVGRQAEGCTSMVANSSADLGIDAAAANRGVAKAYKRADMAKRGADRIVAKMRMHASLAKGLWATGSRPQAICGRQITSLAPSARTDRRRRAPWAIAGKVPGRRLAAAPAAALGAKSPGIKLREQTVEEWPHVWFANPARHQRITQVRGLLYRATASYGNGKWRKVAGPIFASQGEPAEQMRTLPRADCVDRGERRRDFDPPQFVREFWPRGDAAKHPRGGGLQRSGPDARVIAREAHGFTDKGQFARRFLDLRAVAGAQRPLRPVEARCRAGAARPRCGADAETPMH